MKKVLSFIVAVAFVLVFFCACGETRQIYGEWESTSQVGTMLVITEDGEASFEIDGFLLNGTYVIENNVITMYLTDPSGADHTIIAFYELTEDELILTNSLGQSEVFK